MPRRALQTNRPRSPGWSRADGSPPVPSRAGSDGRKAPWPSRRWHRPRGYPQFSGSAGYRSARRFGSSRPPSGGSRTRAPRPRARRRFQAAGPSFPRRSAARFRNCAGVWNVICQFASILGDGQFLVSRYHCDFMEWTQADKALVFAVECAPMAKLITADGSAESLRMIVPT